MPYSFLRLFPLSLLLLAATCQQRSASIPTMKAIEGIWLMSQEENSGDTLVYRPNTYAFPPARGRTGFAFKPFGRFEQFDIAPTDGLAGRPGTWVIDKETHVRIHLDEGQEPEYTLEVLSIDEKRQVLKVRRLPQP